MKSKKGSALLIVLGMLAFMVVSAVAFAAYMRFTRLPSSYLRRTSASRLLAKAALSRAIDEIDRAVCSNLHPGVGDAFVYKASAVQSRWDESSGASRNCNIWKNRVFIGTNLVSLASRSFSDTVPVLNTEALAYIPPPLVNEARYYGRLSPTAGWHALDFDAGRYAYCALDVSDYFDVNRVLAGMPRSSASNARISISHLFENATHTAQGGSDASAWDAWLENYDPNSGKVPLVSLADFNLALKADKGGSIGNLKSPVCSFLGGDASALDSMDVQTEEYCRRMTFVTDSIFPPAPPDESSRFSDDEIYDLGDDVNQPFALEDLEADKPALENVMVRYNSDAITRLVGNQGSISRFGLCALWDYLDPDHVPISLALPTTERVPMVCGFETDFGSSKIKIERQESNSGVNLNILEKTRTVEYRLDSRAFIDGIRAGRVKAILAYPFAHKNVQGDPKANNPFKVDGRLAFFFSSEDMKLRTSADSVLNFGKYANVSSGSVTSDGVMMIPFLKDRSLSLGTGDITTEEQALDEQTGDLTAAMQLSSALVSKPLLKVVYRWAIKFDPSKGLPAGDERAYVSADGLDDEDDSHIAEASCELTPVKATGAVDSAVGNPVTLAATLKGGGGPTLRLNAAVWLRVVDKNGNTVDMAPACIKDDNDLNNCQNYRGVIGTLANNTFGDPPYPLLRLDTGVDLVLKPSELKTLAEEGTEKEVSATPKTFMCADPRYNHAPESWFSISGSLNKNTWLDECLASDRDGDIFMATSDTGYLQSIYELAYLPRTTNLKSHGSDGFRGDLRIWNDNRSQIGSGFNSAINSEFMWRTYRPFSINGQARDDFEDCGFTSAGTGYKVNPYSDSTNIIMSAFANTPVDWRVSGTNEYSVGADMDVTQFNKNYAWNAYASGGNKIEYKDLEAIAGKFMNAVRGSQNNNETRDTVSSHSGGNNWEDVFDGLPWAGDGEDEICGVNLSGSTSPLWISDKKFLYGFWRDCFAARQQLFLIFIRAEPSMMGGEMAGATPPQLGSRAVALVWRDPDSGATAYPHQTRVLFYKPLD